MICSANLLLFLFSCCFHRLFSFETLFIRRPSCQHVTVANALQLATITSCYQKQHLDWYHKHPTLSAANGNTENASEELFDLIGDGIDATVLKDSMKASESDDEAEARALITKQVEAMSPSDSEVRFMMLGLTPSTTFGFILAGLLLSLNTILGNGWASDFLHLGEDNSFVPKSVMPLSRYEANAYFPQEMLENFDFKSISEKDLETLRKTIEQ